MTRTKWQGARRGKERKKAWYVASQGIRQDIVRHCYNIDKARDKRLAGRGKG